MSPAPSKPVRILVLVMIVVVITGILIARSYYGNINRASDSRISHARELYSQYDQVAREGNFYELFQLLDSIELIYKATDHYKASYETGVLENNRAASFLTIALYGDSIARENNPYFNFTSDSLVEIAKTHALKAITIYESWSLDYEELDEEGISDVIRPGFVLGFAEKEPGELEKIIENRVQEILTAMDENDRRLSVCRTNLGVIYRQEGSYLEAVEQYELAIKLWDRNLDAENNLNKLLNKPLKKRTLIQKLFPPEREE